MPGTPAPPPGTNLDAELRRTLKGYFSAMTLDAVLKKIYAEEGLDPGRLTARDLERIYQSSLFLSVRLFCPEARLTQAMLDLAELLERATTAPGRR